QKLFLDFEPIGVTAEGSIAAHHAVTGDEHRDIVRAIGTPRRAHGAGFTYRSSDVRIAARLARRDFPKLAPHRFLEGGALYVEWDMVEAPRGRFDRVDDLL